MATPVGPVDGDTWHLVEGRLEADIPAEAKCRHRSIFVKSLDVSDLNVRVTARCLSCGLEGDGDLWASEFRWNE